MVQLTDVTKSYGSARGVENVSFSISTGSLVGLLGPNGAGKTTIMKIITGYHYANEGTVSIGGFDPMYDGVEVKRLIGYLPENVPVYGEMIVRDYLEFVGRSRLAARDIRTAIGKAAELAGISGVLLRRIGELSKGYRQRVGLAQAILHDPPILILDEPTTGLDPNQIQEIRKLIRRLAEEKTIILSTHILQEVEAICDRVLILNRGRIAAEGSTREIAQSLAGGAQIDLRIRGAKGKAEAVLAALLKHLNAERKVASGEWRGSIEPDKGADIRRFIVSVPAEFDEDDAAAALSDWVFSQDAKIITLNQKVAGLEDLFSQLTTSQGGSAS